MDSLGDHTAEFFLFLLLFLRLACALKDPWLVLPKAAQTTDVTATTRFVDSCCAWAS